MGHRSVYAQKESTPTTRRADATDMPGKHSTLAVARGRIQTKLAVSGPADSAEREADAVAFRVMGMPSPGGRSVAPSRAGTVASTGMGAQVQTKETGGGEARVTPRLQQQIESMRGGGSALPESTRSFMEPRFGQDFGDVRVHTGSSAAESARGLNAHAFTVGNDIAFAEGRFSPSTPEGGHLLAHELTHVVQQRGAGRATAGAVVQRQKAPDPKEKEIKEMATTIAGILNPIISGYGFKGKWSSIQKQIEAPVGTVPGGMKSYAAIYASDIVDKLNAFTVDQRKTIASQVQSQVIESITGKTGEDITTEYNSLDSFVRNNIEPGGGGSGFAGYIGARAALMGKFGSVAKINEYYKALVSADFPSSKVKGNTTKVHANLRANLQKAVTLMKAKKTGTKTWLELAEEGIAGLGGLNIRENRNSTSSLSFHSFGWAIDIDASKNPNITADAFPRSLVTGITGVDVYGGADAQAIRTGGTADELLAHAQAMRDASDTFKATFQDVASFKTGVTTYLGGQGLVIDATQAGDLYTLMTQVSSKKGSNVTVANVETWLTDAYAKSNPPKAPAPGKTAAPTTWAKSATVAAFLMKWYDLFVKAGGQSGKLAKPSVTGTAVTVAANGFITLPAQLIAALTASDGAGLKWLGGIEKGTKDFMHFELKTADQPTITKDVEKPKADAGK